LATSWRNVAANTELLAVVGGANLKDMQLDSGGSVSHENTAGFMQARAAGYDLLISARHVATFQISSKPNGI
jgi:hypothetical protein